MLYKMTGNTGLVAGLVGAVDVGVTFVTWPLFGKRRNHDGATPKEHIRRLPGDDIVAEPQISYTRAIRIHAPPEKVWPWLAQWGQGRGGLYSYDALQNLVGCDIHSADLILPEHQNLQVGDHVLFGPAEKDFPGQVVREVEPNHYLLMVGLDPKTRQPNERVSWLLYLDPKDDGTTHLISRSRNGAATNTREKLLWQIVAVFNFVMERKMLWTIKQYAERGG